VAVGALRGCGEATGVWATVLTQTAATSSAAGITSPNKFFTCVVLISS
jgi:hypothetical protein